MNQQSFIEQYNNNLLNGLGMRLIYTGVVFWMLMALFIPAHFVPDEFSSAQLALLILSLVGAVGVIMVALAARELEKRRARKC